MAGGASTATSTTILAGDQLPEDVERRSTAGRKDASSSRAGQTRFRMRVPTGPGMFCLPTTGKVVPAAPEWFHEIKYDGFRALDCAVEARIISPALGRSQTRACIKIPS